MNTLILERNQTQNKPSLVINERACNPTSKCNFCGHYKLQRGSVGHCQLLNAPVRGGWKSCALAMPPFAPSWEHVEGTNVSAGAFIN
ncbi:hypothetical protein QUB70_20350 [Microcoleus sp. A003_D6]|uniref:hypothetical protein n=1 Tax=Microcoleus sp. A003_D6 TaxID=3055266 RepID=UPI002FD5A7FB